MFERPPKIIKEKQPEMEGEKGITTPESLETKSEITPEQQEMVIRFLAKRLGSEEQILTDEQLVKKVRQAVKEAKIEGDIFTQPEGQPKVFYRAFRPSEEILKWLEREENVQRPFSYAMPGMMVEKPERTTDLPVAYGGENPVLIRIVDTGGYWEDTAPYWFNKQSGQWTEAMNLDPVVLRKINERTLTETEARTQIGSSGGGKAEVRQATFIIDKIKTEQLRNSPNKLEAFLEDTGFWKEISERAKNFDLGISNTEQGSKLNAKYIEYFDRAVILDETKAGDEEAQQAINGAKAEIVTLVKKLLTQAEDNSQQAELINKTLAGLSKEFWTKYSEIEKELIS